MKTLIVYDSAYGNTEKIAKAIGGGIGGEAEVVRAGGANLGASKVFGLLIVGSPTYGGRPTPAMLDFLDKASEPELEGVKVAAFDTRFEGGFSKIFGFAADKIIERLKAKGGVPVAPPEGFIVKGKKGPLKEGELERASAWGKEIAKSG